MAFISLPLNDRGVVHYKGYEPSMAILEDVLKLFHRSKKEDLCYKDFWRKMGEQDDTALSMMDGSPSEEACRLTGQYMAGKIGNALLLGQEDAVLELGCGVGRIGREIAPLCKKWHGADISETLIRIAGKRMGHLKHAEFTALDRTSLHDFPDRSFDKAYSHAVFIHMDKEDLFLYLKELKRVLKPGGLLYFDTWNLKNEVGWERWMMEVETWSQSDQKKRKHVSRNQFSTPEEITLYVERSGLVELFSLSGSFWIQEIAMKPDGQGDSSRKEGLVRSLKQRLDRIAIDPTLVELFSHHLKMLKGQISPAEFRRIIWDREENESAMLYRQWLDAVWKKNEKLWGPVPSKI